MTGRLIVFEGPDGVGKTTVAEAVARLLREGDESVEYLSFPGRETGTVGELVYKIHHDAISLGVTLAPHPVSLQVMHIAAHIDAIENRIVPLLANRTTVVLDRYWWSTWVYGTFAGLPEESLDRMIELELVHWGSVKPSVLFLVDRESEAAHYEELRGLYLELHAREAGYPVTRLNNSGPPEDTTSQVLDVLRSSR